VCDLVDLSDDGFESRLKCNRSHEWTAVFYAEDSKSRGEAFTCPQRNLPTKVVALFTLGRSE
jgi:hypothetical protein